MEQWVLSRMQQPVAGDRSTAVPSQRSLKPSLAADSYCAHRLIEDPEWSLATVPCLTELCLQHIVHNFEKNPILDRLLPEHQREVLDRLPTGLPLAITANLISDEDYWKRCCTERWQVCDISSYGGSWKRMFLERHLENILKCFIPNTTDPNQVLELIPLCKNHVRRLEVDQFLPPLEVDQNEERDDFSKSESDREFREASVHHYDLRVLVTALPHLEELHLTYSVKDCGMNFEWNLFNFTYQDCCNLAVAVKMCQNLKVTHPKPNLPPSARSSNCLGIEIQGPFLLAGSTHPFASCSLAECRDVNLLASCRVPCSAYVLVRTGCQRVFVLTQSKVDDDKTSLLVHSLLDHPCLVELNLSHNLIRDNGAQAIAKLIKYSKLETLNLCNNQIHDVGAQALAQALAESSTLTSLNLRLNCVEDKGGEAIGHALLTNTTLQSLHLGSNKLSEPTAALFSQVLAQNTTLTSINFSCNQMGLDGGKQMLEGLAGNKVLTEFDLRMAGVGQETEYLVHQVLWANREAARLESLQQSREQ